MIPKQSLFLYLAWTLSCIGLLVSLYLSELQHLLPCSLCWYQRISLFPLVIILGVAAYKGFLGIFPYAIPFPFLGLFFSSWQVLMQEFPNLHLSANCSQEISCGKKILVLGKLSLPLLTLVLCLALITLLFFMKQKKSR
ncbi:MAG: disulfide bond formation protein B [Chlamydiae bacterium]|nr:disulfide bond formation protein B [Chlamydiota bacterium]